MESSLSHRLHHSTLASWMWRCIHSTITPDFGVVLRNMVRGGSAYSVLRFWARPGLVKWGWSFILTRFFHFWVHVVYIMPYKVNNIRPFLQVCSHFPANPRTFCGFLRDTPGLLRLAVGVQWGAGGYFAGCFHLNRAELGTLSPRGCSRML